MIFPRYSHEITIFCCFFQPFCMKTPGMNPRQDGTCSAEDAAEGAQRFSGPHVDQTNEETISCGHDMYNMGYLYIHLRLVYHIHYIHYIYIYTDWWFGTFFHILGMNVIIPTDEHIFLRDRYTTNQHKMRI